jgi:7,8-dihydroneopterin aldolase/epimerase/oxygenase
LNDRVFIRNFVLPCNVGITDEERKTKQNVIIDIEIFCDLNIAGVTDNLEHSINYYNVQEQIFAAVSKGEFKLLESLAQTVAQLILKNPLALQVSVVARKEKYGEKPAMGIELTRDRNG